MLTIRENAWHYRFQKFVIIRLYDDAYAVPKSLCTYFWTTVFCLIGAVLYPLFAAIRWVAGPAAKWLEHWIPRHKTAVSYITVAVVASGLTAWAILDIDTFWILPAVIGIVIAVFAIVIGISVLMERHQQAKTPKPGDAKPNLAWEFVKAKKRRVCPLIRVEP